MSSGSLKQFLKKTKKNHKTMNEKVWRESKVLSWFGGFKNIMLIINLIRKGRRELWRGLREGLLLPLAHSVPGLEALVHTNPLCSKVCRAWLVSPVSPDLVPPNRFQSTILLFLLPHPIFSHILSRLGPSESFNGSFLISWTQYCLPTLSPSAYPAI